MYALYTIINSVIICIVIYILMHTFFAMREREVSKVNGFKLMSDSYKKLMNEGKIDKETAEKEIRIYDFLATCDIDDFCRMVDSSAFNDIIRAFLKMAVDNADIDEKSKEKVIGQLRWIFDEKSAKEVLRNG